MFVNYLSEIHSGKVIRIKMLEPIQDNLGGWWTEELWIYDDNYKCYYPTSTYDKDFYTLHTEKEFLFNLSQMLNNEELCISIDVEGGDDNK